MTKPDRKVAVLVDRGEVQKFGLDALDALDCCDEISVFSCTNTSLTRRPLRHGAYYALNLISVRNPQTRACPVETGAKRIAEFVEFESERDGAWQSLPAAIVERLAAFDVVIKLGLGLMRVPDRDRLPAPILSWHHGDPDRYRGRPAGFWEMMDRTPMLGQIVQILSNKLDAGQVVAFAETKVHPHSYRATLIEAYRHSHLLINKAVRNALAGEVLPKASDGKNCRLPSNFTVVRFVARMAGAYVRRLFYGLFAEKSWRVSVAELGAAEPSAVAEGRAFSEPARWRTLPTPRGYLFLADPFFSSDPPGLLVEALNRRSALGEIVLVADGGPVTVSTGDRHLSYPSTFASPGGQLILPEMEQYGAQRCFALRGERLEDVGGLDIEGAPAVLDPTLLAHDGRLYLFGNDAAQGSGALMLWSASGLSDRFTLHPSSPIRISPAGARMAGSILAQDGRLIRFGQNFLGDYGDGVLAFEIERLTAGEYRERPIGSIRFTDRQGPHTINFDGQRIVFDWYRKRFSPLAGLRRFKVALAARRHRPAEI